jgi:hypothetical protein
VHGTENAHVERIQSHGLAHFGAKSLEEAAISSGEMELTEIPFGLGVGLLEQVV